MSYLRDAKLIKTIAENENLAEPSEEACRYILADTELVLRRLVIDACKTARRFHRSKVKSEDVDIAIDSQNLNFLCLGVSGRSPNTYHQTDNSTLELDLTPVLIKDKLAEILKQRLTKKRKIEVSFNWLYVNGKLNPRIQQALAPVIPTPDPHPSSTALQTIELSRSPFEDFKTYDFLTAKEPKAVYLIKEVSPDVITKESGNFFNAFRETLEFYFQKIDNAAESIDYRRLNYSRLISHGHPQGLLQNPDPCPVPDLLPRTPPRDLTRTSRSSTATPKRRCS